MARHPFDPLSFASGVFFVAIGLALMTGDSSAMRLEWVGPAVALGLGVIIVLAVRPRPTPSGETETDPEQP